MHFCLKGRPIVRLSVIVAAQPFAFFMMQGLKSLKLRWRLFLGCGNERVICLFHCIAHQYIHFGSMWQCRPLIAECERLTIIDSTLLTLTLITSKPPLYTQLLNSTNHIPIIDIQYCVCMCYRLHPGVLLPLNFWSTAIHAIYVRDDVAISHSRAFGWQFTACRSFLWFLVNIARLPHLSLSSSFSLICMTHHMPFQLFHPCAQGPCGEVCRWIHGWMQHDGRRSGRFIMSTDHSLYDTYDITQLNFVNIFHH